MILASFKIWNGTAWVPISNMCRLDVVKVEGGGLLNQPTMGVPKIPPSDVPAINATKGLKVNYSYEFLE